MAAQTVGDSNLPQGMISVGRQVLRREVNERIQEHGAAQGTEHFDVFCECGRARCADRLMVSAATYEEVRRFPTRFLVKVGHNAVEHDRTVEELEGFVVVEKFGADGVVAIRSDGRRQRPAVPSRPAVLG